MGEVESTVIRVAAPKHSRHQKYAERRIQKQKENQSQNQQSHGNSHKSKSKSKSKHSKEEPQEINNKQHFVVEFVEKHETEQNSNIALKTHDDTIADVTSNHVNPNNSTSPATTQSTSTMTFTSATAVTGNGSIAPKEFDGAYDIDILPNDNAMPSAATYYIDKQGEAIQNHLLHENITANKGSSPVTKSSEVGEKEKHKRKKDKARQTDDKYEQHKDAHGEHSNHHHIVGNVNVEDAAGKTEKSSNKRRHTSDPIKGSDGENDGVESQRQTHKSTKKQKAEHTKKHQDKAHNDRSSPSRSTPTSNNEEIHHEHIKEVTSNRDPRPSLVKRDVVDYYKNIGELLNKNEFDDAATEVPLLLNNVIDELAASGNIDIIWSLVIHPIISRVVEQVIQLGSERDVRRLFSSLEELYVDLSFNKNGCHIMEALIQRAPQMLMNEMNSHDTIAEENQSVTNSIPSFTQSFTTLLDRCASAGWVYFLTDIYATFVLRSVLYVLQGYTDIKHISAKHSKSRSASPSLSTNRHHVQAFQPHLNGIVESILKASHHDLLNYAYNVTSSPVLQLLIQSLNNDKQHHNQIDDFVNRLLCSSNRDNDNDNTYDPIQLKQMICDRVASHLIECIVVVKYHDINSRMFHALISNDSHMLLELSLHNVANFPTQKLLANLPTQAELQHAIEILSPCFKQLMVQSKPSIIHALLQAAIYHKYRNIPLILNAFYTSSDLTNITKHKIIEQLIHMKTQNPNLHVSSKKYSQYHIVGCQLAQDLMILCHDAMLEQSQDHKDSFNEIMQSLLLLPSTTLHKLATDMNGSHVIDTWFSLANEKQSSKLQAALAGKYVELACSTYGSYVVERLYHRLDQDHNIDRKLKLCNELVRGLNRMAGSVIGSKIVRELKLHQLKRSQYEWVENQKNKEKKLKYFADLLHEHENDRHENHFHTPKNHKEKLKKKPTTNDSQNQDAKEKKHPNDDDIQMLFHEMEDKNIQGKVMQVGDSEVDGLTQSVVNTPTPPTAVVDEQIQQVMNAITSKDKNSKRKKHEKVKT